MQINSFGLFLWVIGSVCAQYTNVTYDADIIDKFGDYSWKEFLKIWKKLHPDIKSELEEKFRELKRECFLSGKCKRKRNDPRYRDELRIPVSTIDQSGICPDQINGLKDFHEVFAEDLDKNTVVVIDQPIMISRSATVGKLRVKDGGILVFKDWGADAIFNGEGHVILRAVNIKVSNEGEFWIGSRACRYQGYADIAIYGDRTSHQPDQHVGYKYLWAGPRSTLEIHGKEKLSWTHLDGGHIYRDSTPTDQHVFEQHKSSRPMAGHRLIFHILSAEGDIKDILAIGSEFTPKWGGGDPRDDIYKTPAEMATYLSELENDENVLFFTDFHFPLTNEIRNMLSPFGFEDKFGSEFDEIFNDSDNARYSLIAGLFNTWEQKPSFAYRLPRLNSENEKFPPIGLSKNYGTVDEPYSGSNDIVVLGPITLSGEKSGDEFQVEINSKWRYTENKQTMNAFTVEKFQQSIEENNLNNLQESGWPDSYDSWPALGKKLRATMTQTVTYSGPKKAQAPILNLAEDVSSWEIGDKIVVASTSWDPRESETFSIVAKHGSKQIEVDRAPSFTHWGRIDSRTGIDQRAEVGLLSRNVRFYGEMDHDRGCQYAFTREQLSRSSPNHVCEFSEQQCLDRKSEAEAKGQEYLLEGETPLRWGCDYFKNMTGEDKDMHGAHMVFTRGFFNVHVSHMELFDVGQPRLARYPVHWHHAHYVGEKGKYDDPSSAISLSIHDSYSRFVTVHGTHEAIVKDNVGYNCVGHGFFLEDGYETENKIIGNLGILVKPGIILPSERHDDICSKTNDGFKGQDEFGNDYPDATIGDNNGKGWDKKACRGLSVFWIANIANFFNDNAAVGGHAGVWSFSHTANEQYSYYSIPRDPVTLRREWSNNKVSASFQGFMMDFSVKDLDSQINAAMPEPKFSIGSNWKIVLSSMNEEDDGMLCPIPLGNDPEDEFSSISILQEFPMCEAIWANVTTWPGTGFIDEQRPNLWSAQPNNWAVQHFDNWKIHHTYEKNWIRNAIVYHDGWQLSDNMRAWQIKAKSPVHGARKSFDNSLFVGFTKNTGHRVCGWTRKSWNLAHIIQCSDEDNRDESIRPYDAGKQYLDRFCPGWPKTPDTAMESCPIVKPMTGDMHHQIYWWKPEGGVYRSAMFPWRYPIQGLSIYDNWMPTQWYGNTFYDFPGKDAFRHAMGTHLGNAFQTSTKMQYIANNTFINVDREMQFSKISTDVFNGDRDNVYNWYGVNYEAEDGTKLERDLGDGEKNAGFVDWDGRWTKDGKGPAYILPREATTVNTGCYDQENISGMIEPLGKVCPIDLELGFFGASVRVRDQTSDGHRMHIKSATGDFDEMITRTASRTMSASFHWVNVEAYHPYMIRFSGTMPDLINLQMRDAEKDTWYRFSVCVGQNPINLIDAIKIWIQPDAKKCESDGPCKNMAPDGIDFAMVNSLQELQFVNDRQSYFYDLENGWLHVKMPILHDRTKGGTLNFWGRGWREDYEISDAPNYPGYKFGSAHRFNMPEGMDAFKIRFESENPDIPDLTATCPDFIEPAIIEPVTCDDGFVVDTATNTCENVNECENGTPCGANAECNDNDGSFVCECHLGWNTGASDAEPCEDVDECLLGSCAAPADCNNFDGGFTCSCPAGYTLNDDSLGCNDNNECDNGDHNCDANAGCTNIDGSFECACNGGFSGSGTECEDDNECDNPDACPANAACTNFNGGFECTCKDGFGRSLTCDNLNECNLGTHNCHANAICTDTTGSFECNCLTGFEGSGQSCKDVNECDDPDFCGANADCTNLTGGFSCTCKDGFGDNAAGECVDIKECETGDHTCDDNASCTDTEGSFECECNSGWDGDGHTCDDVDECLIDVPVQCPDTAICTDFDGGFSCECKSGFTTDDTTSPITCNDIDECTDGTHTCDPDNGICNNNDGSFECSCQDGWAAIGGIADTLCSNIDECLHPNFHNCDINAKCDDNDGSFTCTCLDGFTGDGTDGNCVEDSVELVDECALGTHDCDLTTTICEDTDAGYLCNCKDRYLATDSANTCVFDIDSCDSKADLGVAWKGVNKCKPTANNAMFVDEGDALAIKCNIPGTAETAAYTGFNIFTKKYCGSDFIAGIADGRIRFEYADKASQYETSTNAYLRDDKDIPARSSATTQWTSPANSVTSNTGNTKKDIAWLIIKGLKNVDMGSKSLSDCLVKTQVGIIPGEIKTQDETGCVGNQKNVNWRTEEAIRRSEGL